MDPEKDKFSVVQLFYVPLLVVLPTLVCYSYLSIEPPGIIYYIVLFIVSYVLYGLLFIQNTVESILILVIFGGLIFVTPKLFSSAMVYSLELSLLSSWVISRIHRKIVY